ncbi:MAG: PDZ domain-containing protein [Patescibacteria group bacterium]
MKDRSSKFAFWGTALLLAILAGALAGIIATVYTNQSIERYIQSLADGDSFISISQVKPRPLPGTYEEALDRVQETGWPAFVSFLPASTDSARVNDWLGKEDAVGSGIVITNDGWILSHTSSLPNNPLASEAWIAGKRYEVVTVIEDDLTDYVLLRVEAQGLQSIAFAASEEMSGGEIIFNIPALQELISANLESASLHDSGFVLPAEEFIYSWKISKGILQGPLLNSNGELIGFVAEAERAVPIHHAVDFVQSVVRGGEPQHAAIGAYTTDISSVINISSDLTSGVRVGALIESNVRGVAVLRNSPAATAGLEVGDVILSLDGTLVSGEKTLAEILTEYEVGDRAELHYWRNGEEKSVEIVFTNFADLVY